MSSNHDTPGPPLFSLQALYHARQVGEVETFLQRPIQTHCDDCGEFITGEPVQWGAGASTLTLCSKCGGES